MRNGLMIAALMLAAPGLVLAETYQVVPEESIVEWEGTKITGRHNGTVEVESGEIVIEDGYFAGGSAVIDMSTITVLDIEDPDTNQKLVDHLKSDDFFGVAEHPTATLEIDTVSGGDGGVYDVVGRFTIKGTSRPVNFQAEVIEEDGQVWAEADITLDRTDFDVRYGSGKFFDNLGDRLIHDDFVLTVGIVAE